MWRFLQAVPRAIRQQWNSPIRPSPQSVHCEDDAEGLQKPSLIPKNYLQYYPRSQRWMLEWQPEGDKRSTSDRRRAQRHNSWSLPNCNNSFLEAVGLGTAVLLGLQLSKIYHIKSTQEQRQSNSESDDNCPLRWLKKIPALAHHPHSISYISSPPHAVSGTKNRADHSAYEDELVTESVDNLDVLDYESLLDIEVRSQQFDCRLHPVEDYKREVSSDRLAGSSESNVEYAQKQPKHTETESEVSQREHQFKEAVDEWCTLSNSCIARVHHQFAVQHIRQGQLDKAFDQWQQACEQGDPRAHFNLALCYELGKGTPQDCSKAVDHYGIAAAGGHHIAMYNLAVYYLTGKGGVEKDMAMATSLLEKAATEGLTQAQTNLGIILGEDNGDWQQAANLFTSAAEKHDVSAKYYLASCYENGWGIPRNLDRAAALYMEAAAAGHGMALHSMGLFKEKGVGGVLADRTEAKDLYQRAVRAGHHAAQADHSRLSRQLNQEKFEAELQELQQLQYSKPDVLPTHSKRSQSSPALSHASLSFYIRNNLLDFGLDDSSGISPGTSPTHTTPGTKVKFHIGDSNLDTPPPEPGGHMTAGGFELLVGGGGFGNFKMNKKLPKHPKKATEKFDPTPFHGDLANLKELEQQTEMRMVLCS